MVIAITRYDASFSPDKHHDDISSLRIKSKLPKSGMLEPQNNNEQLKSRPLFCHSYFPCNPEDLKLLAGLIYCIFNKGEKVADQNYTP